MPPVLSCVVGAPRRSKGASTAEFQIDGKLEDTALGYYKILSCATIMDYIDLTISWYGQKSYVTGSALALYVFVFRKLTGANRQFGDALPYARNSDMTKFRQKAVKFGMLDICLAALDRRDDNPLLIRYSLWMLLLFVSENPKNTAVKSALDVRKFPCDVYGLTHVSRRTVWCGYCWSGRVMCWRSTRSSILWRVSPLCC